MFLNQSKNTMSESEEIEANAASPIKGQVQLRLEGMQAKTQRMNATKGRKLDSFRRELVRTQLNEMIDDKRRSCRVKSKFEKLLNVVEKLEKKAQEIDAQQGNEARSIECEQNKNAVF